MTFFILFLWLKHYRSSAIHIRYLSIANLIGIGYSSGKEKDVLGKCLNNEKWIKFIGKPTYSHMTVVEKSQLFPLLYLNHTVHNMKANKGGFLNQRIQNREIIFSFTRQSCATGNV